MSDIKKSPSQGESDLFHELLTELRLKDQECLNTRKIYFGSVQVSGDLYDRQAKILKNALLSKKENFIQQLQDNKVSLQSSYHLIANINGFNNWQTMSATIVDFDNEDNAKIVEYIRTTYSAFLKASKESKNITLLKVYDWDNTDYVNNLESFCKKIDKLNHILSGKKNIDTEVRSFILDLFIYFISILGIVHQNKINDFISNIHDQRNVDLINRFEWLRENELLLCDRFEDLSYLFEHIRCSYSVIHLIRLTHIFAIVDPTYLQLKSIVNTLVFCLANVIKFQLYQASFKSLSGSLAQELSSSPPKFDVEKIGKKFFLNFI